MGKKKQYGFLGIYDTLNHSNGSTYASAQFQQNFLLPELKAYALDLGHSPVILNIDPTRYQVRPAPWWMLTFLLCPVLDMMAYILTR